MNETYAETMSFKRAYLGGFLAATILLVVYTLVLTLSNSLAHAIEEFLVYWYWIAPLIVGFGLQAGLYLYIRTSISARKEKGTASAAIATAGGVSTTSMVACCAHHITDVLPLVGLSAAVVFLNQFQSLFFLLGIVSNTVGIILMLKIIQQHGLYSKDGLILPVLMRINMTRALYISIMGGAVILLISLYKKLSAYGGV
ncbi:MAG: hypothetical protein GXO97_04805 [Nitrospirae bacterium]|nr:hypothetical protein [Nitrospirota bacterium]